MANATTLAIRGVAAEIRKDGFCWRAVVKHLGGGGTDYFKFNGRWNPIFQSDIPVRVYRALRVQVREAVRLSLPVRGEA